MARRSSPPPPSIRRSGRGPGRAVARSGQRGRGAVVGTGVVVVLTVAGAAWYGVTRLRPERLRARAEAASRAGDWPTALSAWREVNASPRARGETFLAE